MKCWLRRARLPWIFAGSYSASKALGPRKALGDTVSSNLRAFRACSMTFSALKELPSSSKARDATLPAHLAAQLLLQLRPSPSRAARKLARVRCSSSPWPCGSTSFWGSPAAARCWSSRRRRCGGSRLAAARNGAGNGWRTQSSSSCGSRSTSKCDV